jgi:hypothetical protein
MVRALFCTVLFLSLFVIGCRPAATPELVSKGRDLVPSVCTRCHPLSKVHSHKDDRSGWYRLTDRMKTHGANFSNEEQDAITAYLAETQPKK